MNCREYRARLVEFARGGALDPALAGHLEDCPECAELLERQLSLTRTMRSLAGQAPQAPDLPAGLRAEFERHHRRPMPRWVQLAIAASILAGVGVVWYRPQPRPVQVTAVPAPAPAPVPVVQPAPAAPRPVPTPVRKARRPRPRVPEKAPESRPFVPIPYTEPLAPYERASVMRMDVPVAAVIAAGFRVITRDPGANVQADLLVGEDGRARAIRLLNVASYPSERSIHR